MNFSGEDRKEVFFFFEAILNSYKQPVYYENLRGHISKAPDNVRKYVLIKCRGDHFLEYFKRRKNYFNVEDGKISLKEEYGHERVENPNSDKSKKRKGKFVRKNISYSYSSYAGALKGKDSNINGEKEYETYTVTYFRNRLIRKKKERLYAIYFEDLPKKVKRHLQLYYRSEVRNFFSDYPDKFVINADDETVSVGHVIESNTNTIDSSLVNQESPTKLNQASDDIAVDSEIKNASDYLESVIFFIDILKKLNQPFPIEKLGGYFSQARKEIKDHIKINYRSFKFFFDDAPLIFLKNASGEVSLSLEYRKIIKAADNLVKDAKNGLTSVTEMPLKSHIIHIFQPQISSQDSSSSCLEETDSIDVLSYEGNNLDDSFEEMLLDNDSPDDFFDNYLMRSTSRSRSHSVSSKCSQSFVSDLTQIEDSSVIKSKEVFGCELNAMQGFNDMDIVENTFLKCIFTVELFCLEYVESELNYIQSYENKAVEYFMKILDPSETKMKRLSSLQGSIGNNREIAQFMNKLYRGEKFVSFFEKHPQFEVEQPFVKLALSNETNCSKDLILFSDEKNAIKDLKDLYELNDFKILLRETYVYLYEVSKFCKDKNTEIDRLSGVLARFPICLNMIKLSKGESLPEKIENFLRGTMIFKFPKKGIVIFPYDYFYKNCNIILAWFEEINCNDPSEKSVNVSDFWKNFYSKSVTNSNRNTSFDEFLNLEECYQDIIDVIKAEIEIGSEINYSDLSKIGPKYVLLKMTNSNYITKSVVSNLLKSENFRMKNGKITLERTCENNKSDSIDNSLSETISGSENHISVKNSNELYVYPNRSNTYLVDSSCLISINSKDINSHNKESQSELEYCSNQSSKTFQTTENIKTKQTDSNNVESKSNFSVKNDKIPVNLFISEGQNKNLTLVNENHISEPVPIISLNKQYISASQDECKIDINVHNREGNLCSDVPLTDAENLNPSEEIVVNTKSSKSVLSKIPVQTEKGELIDDASNTCHVGKDEVNKTNSPLHNSDALDELNVSTLSSSPDLEEYPQKNQSILSASDSKDLRKQEVGLNSDEILLTSHDLDTINTAHLNEQIKISATSKVKSLEKDNLDSNNVVVEVVNKNAIELNMKATEVKQNIPFTSEDEESSKFKIDLINKRKSIVSVHVETDIAKKQKVDDLALCYKDKNIKVSTEVNGNPEYCEVSEPIFQNDVPEKSDLNGTKTQTRKFSVPDQNLKETRKSKEQLGTINRNIDVSTKQPFTYIPEELFDTSLMKMYLNSGKIYEENNHPSIARPVVESVEESSSKKAPFEYSSPAPTFPPGESKETILSRTSSCDNLSSEYPMQPITAKIVLLTNNSCIALADIKKRKQNIYFFKYVFTCDHQDDCFECFSTLQIGDEVSCFVPLTEISKKIWIACMVTKDDSDSSNELGIFEKLGEDAKVICEGTKKSIFVSNCHFGCQTEFLKSDHSCQTNFACDVDLFKASKESSCQTNFVPVKHIAIQTENVTKTCIGSIDSEILLCREQTKSQTCCNGDSQNEVTTAIPACQAIRQGEGRQLTKNVSCQTFSTGYIMMYKHYPI